MKGIKVNWHLTHSLQNLLSFRVFIPLNNKRSDMIIKTQLICTIESLPENLIIEQVVDHLVFIDKVQKGLKDS